MTGEVLKAPWRPISEAKKDGRLLILLVDYSEETNAAAVARSSAAGYAWFDNRLEDETFGRTLGSNNFDNDGEDLWRFAGWNWSQDFWCEGDGTPVAFIELDAVTAPDPSADAWELVDKLTRALTGLTSGGSEFFVRCGERFVADTDSCLAYIKAARDGRLATLKAAIAAKQKAQAEADALRAENERLRAENAELAAANQRLGRLGRIVERERDELAARSVEGRDG